jgi:hypothetical protein
MKVEDVAEKAVSILLKTLSVFEKFDPSVGSMEVSLKIFPIKVDEKYMVFVPVGTRDKPTGISNTDAQYVLLFKSQDEYKFIEINDFKKSLAAVWVSSEKRIDEDYKYMGVQCYYRDFN